MPDLFDSLTPKTAESYTAKGEKVVHRRLQEGDEIKVGSEPISMGELQSQIAETLPILKDILTDVRQLTSGPMKETGLVGPSWPVGPCGPVGPK